MVDVVFDPVDPEAGGSSEKNPFTAEVQEAADAFSLEMQLLREIDHKIDENHREMMEAIKRIGRLG